MNTQKNTYTNTAKGNVLNFIQSLEPTASEAPFIASIFAKNHVSMKDFKVLLEFLARRAVVKPLDAHKLASLGLPALPPEAPSVANTYRLSAPA